MAIVTMCCNSLQISLLLAPPEPSVRTWYPSITEVVPPTYSDLRQEFGKLETLQWDARARSATPAPAPVLPGASDRIHTVGYDYCPVHTEIYGTYRARDARGC